MFRTLLAHPQEALHKPKLVYCVRVISVGCTVQPPEDEQVILETCKGP
jgi:hypothetical protein